MGKLIDLTDKTFGRWKVVRFDKIDNRKSYWFCQCNCGTERVVNGVQLTSGRSKSCGCWKLEKSQTHKQSKTREYRIWAGMLQRCLNENAVNFDDYSKRGVCERWLKFENFFEDMGKCPKGLTLERKKNDLGYFPEICIWATSSQQNLNRSNRKMKSSKFRGVNWDKTRDQWASRIILNGKQKFLGRYESEEVAAEKFLEAYYNNYGKFPPEFKPVIIPERLKCV